MADGNGSKMCRPQVERKDTIYCSKIVPFHSQVLSADRNKSNTKEGSSFSPWINISHLAKLTAIRQIHT